jgi:hypothetical protein
MSIESDFWQFHYDNPRVYEELVKLARQTKRAGKTKCGIGMLWEVLRWNFYLKTRGDDEFRLNNNYRSHYSRLIMQRESDLEGFFPQRRLRSA